MRKNDIATPINSDPKDADLVIALAGNPNVGKSTIFNSLTGMHQHTGNWTGKTVAIASGRCKYNGLDYLFVDLPGTYSLMAHSAEEEVARDYICFGMPDVTVVICDATCIEHNLNLVLQTLEITKNVIVCVNLLDEATRKNIYIDLDELSKQLDVPVIGTNAIKKSGISELLATLHDMNLKKDFQTLITYPEEIEEAISILLPPLTNLLPEDMNYRWVAIRLLDRDQSLLSTLESYIEKDTLSSCELVHPQKHVLQNETLKSALDQAYHHLSEKHITDETIKDAIVSSIITKAEDLTQAIMTKDYKDGHLRDRKIDKVLTSRYFGTPIMIMLMLFIFWITITGANIPSALIYNSLFYLGDKLTEFLLYINAPMWFREVLISGVYRVLAWVISVMLPPMAIFFPLFTILEDLGYLPRIAFNLDHYFKKAKACGKQALTMAMGFGCNAVGVAGCRIIDSPRERLIAILTNCFVPCNGRFPTIISIISMFFVFEIGGIKGSILSTLLLTTAILLGIGMTLLISRLLSMTLLRGVPSSFTLELPPYRKPQFGKVILRSVLDRTLFVLGRAVVVAAPAGLVIWLFANIMINDSSLLSYCTNFLDPIGHLMGLDGTILMAFILGFPANEIVVPIMIMTYLSQGSIMDMQDASKLKTLLTENGWTLTTAISFIVFSLFHWPCSTTMLTILKETESKKWTLAAFLIPTTCGFVLCTCIQFVASFVAGLFS